MDSYDFEFLTVDEYIQEPSNQLEGLPNFGFTFVFKRSSRHYVHSRTVYTVLEFLGVVGGLKDFVVAAIQSLMSFFVPSLFTRSFLNNYFDQDSD